MIHELLHRRPVALDRQRHAKTRLAMPVTDWRVASRLNSIFVAAVEFTDVAREYPIVFIPTAPGEDGSEQIAPIAVLGVEKDRNLYLDGPRWRATYVPAVLRCYPFCIGRLDTQRFAVCFDGGWEGVSEGAAEGAAEGGAAHGAAPVGTLLFGADGEPTQMTKDAVQHLERVEAEVQRTRLACKRLRELDLLREMRFDATLPDGRKHAVDGFLAVEPDRLAKLPDADVLELHKSGLLGLIHAHRVSLGHMNRLVAWMAAAERPAA
jgi:hypothetical protein